MIPVDSGRITRTFVQTIVAPPDRVFPLLCPVRETEWLEGWGDGLEILHSRSGLAEEGCVFRKTTPDGPETVWMITRHDADARAVEFVRVTTGLAATRLRIRVENTEDESSRVHIEYTATPLGDRGRAFLAETFSETAFEQNMRGWETSMNHWLRTGQLLRAHAD